VDERERRVAEVLREAAGTHHRVYRITDGDDPDWPLWYAEWLATLSELPQLLDRPPTRSELAYLLVKLDREYRAGAGDEPWQEVYARELIRFFGSEGVG
jgi:hypothetical protein